MENLNHIINQLDLIEIYRTLYLTVVEHTLFEAHATYIKIDIMACHELSQHISKNEVIEHIMFK